jgi:hypothetical protein
MSTIYNFPRRGVAPVAAVWGPACGCSRRRRRGSGGWPTRLLSRTCSAVCSGHKRSRNPRKATVSRFARSRGSRVIGPRSRWWTRGGPAGSVPGSMRLAKRARPGRASRRDHRGAPGRGPGGRGFESRRSPSGSRCIGRVSALAPLPLNPRRATNELPILRWRGEFEPVLSQVQIEVMGSGLGAIWEGECAPNAEPRGDADHPRRRSARWLLLFCWLFMAT